MQDEEISLEQCHGEPSESKESCSRESEPGAKGGKQAHKKERHSPQFEGLLKELEAIETAEGKLEKTLAFMEKSIGEGQSADFKTFWDARMKCLTLFKENIPPFLRTQLWTKFSELSKEARRLKDILDEQSEFAAEQIDIAITSIESELDHLQNTLEKGSDFRLATQAFALKNHFDLYARCQQELFHLNLLASRITSLRKELIKTDMRIRVKNKFFERMSKAGDRVFPRRKSLIQEISQAFASDVNQFIQHNFGSGESRVPLFEIREEIKALQSAAKDFTLNTQVFSQTRLLLSECWDKLKEKDKERKEEFDKRREVFKQNEVELAAKIEEAETQFHNGELNLTQAAAFQDAFAKEMRARELGREEVKTLKDKLQAFRDKVGEMQRAADADRHRQDQERLQQKRALFQGFHQKCLELLENGKTQTSDELLKGKELLAEEIQNSALGKAEKQELDKTLKPIKEILRAKREEALLNLPADKRLALEQLKELLKQKCEERQEVQENIKRYRKLIGASGNSIEKSMEYNAQIGQEREALDRVQEAVKEIEGKIDTLESTLS